MEIRENKPYDDIMIGNRENRYVLWTKDEFYSCSHYQIAAFFRNHEIAVDISPDKLSVWGGSLLYDIIFNRNERFLTDNPDIEVYENSHIEKYRIEIPKNNMWYNWCVKKLFRFHLRETIRESEELINRLNLGEEVTFTNFLINGVKEGRFEWNFMKNEDDLRNAGLLP